MASYHFNAAVISYSGGRTAVAAAAYRSAQRFVDVISGITHDYSKKAGVDFTTILAPGGAPDWATEREQLWNRVQQAEILKGKRNHGRLRVNARFAREIRLAVPCELTTEQQNALVVAFAREQFVARGMVADVCIHRDNPNNPHAHIMLPTRTIGPEGFGGKDRSWNAKDLHLQWRAEWADAQNLALIKHGFSARVDHRSFAERGIDLEPTLHLGPSKHHDHFDRALDHRALLRKRAQQIIARPDAALTLIAEKNPEFTEAQVAEWVARNVSAEQADRVKLAILSAPSIQRISGSGLSVVYTTDDVLAKEAESVSIVADPSKAIEEFSKTRATFSEADLNRFLTQTVNHANFAPARESVLASPEIIRLGSDDYGKARYTTRRELDTERQLADIANTLAGRNRHKVRSKHIVPPSISRRMGLEQELAYRAVVRGTGDVAVVQGFAGAGKSFMLEAAREAWEAAGYRVHGAALAGKAADGLQADSGIPSRTIASWLLAWSNDRDSLSEKDVFVVDEVGMVGAEQLRDLMAHIRDAGAKVVLVGDAEQLQSIDAGAGMRIVAERVGQSVVSLVRRQQPNWM